MFIDRRTFVKGAAVASAAAVAPQVLVKTARGQDKNKVLFVSEESNPKAIAVYDKINADFKKETGIEVVMEYPGFANIAKRVATLIAAGTPPEIPSWGNIMAEGRTYVMVAIWVLLFPGIFLTLVVLGVNLLGDGLRDTLDPRLRRTTGSL